MTKRISIFWTPQARDDVRSIRAFIARDAPKTASAFVRRLQLSVNRLRTFPHAGYPVPELKDVDIREILFGTYRIIYHSTPGRIEVLTVYHSSRLLEDNEP